MISDCEQATAKVMVKLDSYLKAYFDFDEAKKENPNKSDSEWVESKEYSKFAESWMTYAEHLKDMGKLCKVKVV